MKFKFILCLAFVLSGGLSGCGDSDFARLIYTGGAGTLDS
jgi:hypothetical protein